MSGASPVTLCVSLNSLCYHTTISSLESVLNQPCKPDEVCAAPVLKANIYMSCAPFILSPCLEPNRANLSNVCNFVGNRGV